MARRIRYSELETRTARDRLRRRLIGQGSSRFSVHAAAPQARHHRVSSGGLGHQPASLRDAGSRISTSAARFLQRRQRVLTRISPSVPLAPERSIISSTSTCETLPCCG